MPRPSEPLLTWLRGVLDERGISVARLAKQTGLARPRTRRILTGREPMNVDELLLISQTLELSPQDLGLGSAELEAAEDEVSDTDTEASAAPAEPVVDPWGNQPEQLFRIAFALGCDFFFTTEVSELTDSGVPGQVLEQYRGRELPIKLDAAYHRDNDPRYGEDGITLVLSFDSLYTCTFPWSAIRQFILFPSPPEAEPEPEPVPHLRLVT